MEVYQKQLDHVFTELDSSQTGLSREQANQRLKQYGPNRIRVTTEPLWRKIIEPIANVFMVVLLLAAVISFINRQAIDGIIIVMTIAISAGIYYAQRFSTERILRALQRYEQQTVEVMRDGQASTIDATELVPGDVIMLNEGEKIPADARIIEANNVRADESVLTGESAPVNKGVGVASKAQEVYEQTNMLFQGSFIVAGQATALVVKTANTTEFGQLAELSQNTDLQSPVQQKIDRLVSRIILVVAGMAGFAFVLSLLRGFALTEALRFVLTLSVSAVPEGLPVAITVVLVLGMRRMAKQKVLVRNMRAIENIGVITTIATDKTGTLTKNKLTVVQALDMDGTDAASLLAAPALLAVNQDDSKRIHDPLDVAMKEFSQQLVGGHPTNPTLVASIPFEHQFSMSGNVWKQGSQFDLVVKGAPEHIMRNSKLTTAQRTSVEQTVHALSSQGFKVLVLARATLTRSISSLKDLKAGSLEILGILAVADVLRPEAQPAIAAAQAAGVTVRMITGDHHQTAYQIGQQLGMVTHESQVYDSRQTNTLSPKVFAETVASARVFSRVIPEHKYKILEVLKKTDITAMTGDGVNDVPALTHAHVGIAMGSGSQIAKEAADIVLLDNNFKSIVIAMREGRIIFSNIRRMLFYLLSTNAGEVITMIGALIIGMPLPLVAVQILWVNLVTDTLLVIPLGLEPGEKTVMQQAPRSPESPILDRFTIRRMVLVAASMAAVSLLTFAYFHQSHGEAYARTLTFSVLVVMQWANAFNARSELQSVFSRLKVHNGKFYIGLLFAVGLQLMALYGPLAGPLHVVPVDTHNLITTALIAVSSTFLVSEVYKLVERRKLAKL